MSQPDIADNEIAVMNEGQEIARLPVPGVLRLSLQNTMQRVARWLRSMHNSQLRTNKRERALRLVEEAIELAQATGEVTLKDVLSLADHVMSREPGTEPKEAAGVMVTLLSYCACNDIDLGLVFEDEMQRIEHPDFGARIAAAQERKRAAGLDADSDVREMLTRNERIIKLARFIATGLDIDWYALPGQSAHSMDMRMLLGAAEVTYQGTRMLNPHHELQRLETEKGW